MRIHDSIKNIFLLVVFVCIFFVSVGEVGAIEADPSGNVINYEGGSYYNTQGNSVTGTTVIDKVAGVTASKNLYSPNQQKVKIDAIEASILSKKLKTGGSNFNTAKITAQSVTVKNTDGVSVFEFDPTPDNVTNNDSVVLGAASKTGKFYIAKEPMKVETGTKTSLNSLTANGFLNTVDRAEGLPAGTTIDTKNKIYDLKKDDTVIQEKIVKTSDEMNKAWDDLQKSIARGDASSTVDQYQQAFDKAQVTFKSNMVEGSKINRELTAAEKAAEASANQPAPVDEYKCELLHPLNCVIWTVALLSNIVFKLTSFLAYLAGTLFDYSLELSINSAEFFKKLGVVEITWSFIRDILNMTFIFILLWTAIQILITNDAKYNAKKILINVVIVAILMNFSLFAAKLMVDASNVVSLKIYEAMKTTKKDASGKLVKGSSISIRVMDTVGISSLYNISDVFKTDSYKAEGPCAKNPVSLVTVSVMGSIFLIVLILALGLAAILFLIRLVNIIYLFIKSPLWVWGHVIPGNKMMEKLKNDWWSEMKHVLIFPIAYLFWMLIAIIIFEKLGTVTNTKEGGKSLLDLVCQPPGATGLGESISLLAIFVIVIIFMMKAIEYGVKHASDGGSDALGQGATNWATKKFGGYQTAMTKGLATWAGTKAKNVAVSSSVGATKVPLRAVTGLTGGLHSKFVKKESFWKGANDGFSNPGINIKEAVGTAARNQALRGGILGTVGELTGINKKAAALAKKYEDPVNALNETRKKADERRTKSTVEHQNNINSAIEAKFKIPTQEEWEKRYNKGNKIVTDEDAERFELHINNIVQQRADATLGKGIISQSDDRDKEKTDGPEESRHGGKRSHLEIMKSKTIKRENILDDDGNIIGKKVKFDELAMHDSMMNVLEYNTKGEGKNSENITNNKTKLETYRNIKAQAKIKAINSGIAKSKSGALSKDAEKKQLEKLEKTIQKMQKIQDTTNKDILDKCVKDGTIYKGEGDNEKTMIKFNEALAELQRAEAAGAGSRTPPDLTAQKDAVERAKKSHLDFLDKHSEELIKKQNLLAKKIKDKEEADTKK